MNNLRRIGAALAASVLALTALSACSNDDPGSTSITVVFGNSLARVPWGGFYLLGVDKGFFAEEGIDKVTVQVAADSSTATQTVSTDRAQFSVLTTVPSFLAVAAKGVEVTMVGQDSAASEIGVFSDPKSHISTPRDLVGKTVAVPPGTPQAILWDSYLAAAGLKKGEVESVNVAANGLAQALISGRVDAIVQSKLSAVPQLRGAGLEDPSELPFSDVDLDVSPGSGVVVSKKFAKGDAETVRAFLAAARRSLAYALEHPDELVEAINDRYPDSTSLAAVKGQIAMITAGFDQNIQPEGWLEMDPEAWADTIAQLTEAGSIEAIDDPTSVYSNDFLEP